MSEGRKLEIPIVRRMRPWLWALLCLLPVLSVSPAEAQPSRPFGEERQLLDRHLAQLAEALPDSPSSDRDAALMRELAAQAGFRNVEVSAPIVTERDTVGKVQLKLRAETVFHDVDRFVRLVGTSARLIDTEKLVLTASLPVLRVEFDVATFYYVAPRQETQKPVLRSKDRGRATSADETARFARDSDRAAQKSVALDQLRRAVHSARLFVSELSAISRDRPIALTYASYAGAGDAFLIRGLVIGVGGSLALERRIEQGFFRVKEHLVVRESSCFRFETTGTSAHAGVLADLPQPVDDPFADGPRICESDRDPVGTPSPIIRKNGAAGITLRATDVDVSDVFAALELLSRERFVVEGAMRGRVSVDWLNVPIDEAIASLGVKSERVGSLRLVRSALGAGVAVPSIEGPAEDATDGSHRASSLGKRLRASAVFADIAQAQPGLAAFGPRELPPVSVFARDAPALDLYRALLAALGLEERREDTRRILTLPGSNGGSTEPIVDIGDEPPRQTSRDLAVEELLLAGIGRSGETMMAFVYSPLGRLVGLRLNDELADGRVVVIDSSSIVVDSSEGPIRITLR